MGVLFLNKLAGSGPGVGEPGRYSYERFVLTIIIKRRDVLEARSSSLLH